MGLEQRLRIAVDVPGGDLIKISGQTITHEDRCLTAAIKSISQHQGEGITYVLAGDKNRIKKALDEALGPTISTIFYDPAKPFDWKQETDVIIVHEPDMFPMEGTIAKDGGKPSTVKTLAQLHAAGNIDAFYSSGNSAATVYFAWRYSKPLMEVKPHDQTCRMTKSHPSLPAVIPRGFFSRFYLTDVGANKESEPVDLLIAAMLTETYANAAHGTTLKKIGLLDNPTGREAEQYFAKLTNYAGLKTVKDAFSGEVDLLVTDGFTGNIALKTIEAAAEATVARLKTASRKQRFAPYLEPKRLGDNYLFNTTENHPFLLIPCDNPEKLEEQVFAALESLKECLIPPNIGVLSNGEEDVKGNKQAQRLLEKISQTKLGKIGYVEPSDCIRGYAHRKNNDVSVDMVISDPHTAAIFADTVAAVESGLHQLIKPHYTLINLLKYKLFKKGPLAEVKRLMDKSQHNGSGVFGTKKQGAVVGHGAADEEAIYSGIEYTIRFAQSGYITAAKQKIPQIELLLKKEHVTV